ncbi:unnamed protein product [Lactuca virosa]|uniref:RRM domain-containing protein n=1 Tax=Lactuca virosa TaxID=75947 RepID=A0AAU9MVD9_9ASTR|nr:unnamed protein product [Lactuca virosa]
MGPPVRPNKQSFGTANAIGKQNLFESSSDAMFNNLWVGNLAADVTDSNLRNLFEKHGAVDSVTCYPSRSYAFVNMKRPEDAKRAKESLQGFVLRGSALKIDFAKPAKPCKSLWVSGISSSTTKEDLEEEFSKFGKFEDFKFLRDKNTAYIDYSRLEDASKALKMMHGKKRGGSVIRVDYLRSQPKRDQGPDFRDAKEGQHFRSMVPHDSPWFPPDSVKNYPDSSYYGPKRQQHNILGMEGRKGDGEQASNVLVISYPPIVHIDEQMLHNAMILFGEIDDITSFPSRHHYLVEFRSIEEAQLAKDGLQGRLFNDPRISITFATNDQTPNKDIPGFHPHGIFNEPPPPHLDAYVLMPNRPYVGGGPFVPPDTFDPPEFPMSMNMNPMGVGVPNWRRSSPNPSPGPGTWDVFDGTHLHREPKRLRTEGNIPLRDMNDQDPYGGGGGRHASHPGCDYIWRGVIAKGGTPVCHARCVPIRDWIGYEIPEVVNCSARTGLDMLAKHYTDAIGFDIVFFLPDSEEDFASYTEFVRYLGDRNRAGVAKFDDGTTLFLVPPSDFLSNVLNVSGPERLYGVILKFPQPPPPQYIDKQQIPPQNDYNVNMPGGGEKLLQIDYSGVPLPHEDLKSPAPPPQPQPQPLSRSTPPRLSLTPELIATLASLAKGKFNGGQQQPSATSASASASASASERPWEYEPEPSGRLMQQAHAQPQVPPGYGGQDVNFTMPQGQSGQFAVPSQQQYVPNFPYGFEQKPDALSQVYGGGGNVYQPQSMGGEQKTDGPLGSQIYGGNVYQPQNMGGGENSGGGGGVQLPEQMQQLHLLPISSSKYISSSRGKVVVLVVLFTETQL